MRRDAAAIEARRRRAQDRQPETPTRIAEPKYRTPDTVDDMLLFAKELGWTAIRTRDDYRLLHPSGLTASLHLTPSDKAVWRNLRSRILRPVRENR